jgi:hypothetical protein
MEAKLIAAKVLEHKCMKGGIKGWCYCRFCRKFCKATVQGEESTKLIVRHDFFLVLDENLRL